MSVPSKPRSIAAIPCHNEERFIGDVVLKARGFVDEVVIIDDGSSDGTARAARASGASVVRHPVNQGYGRAITSCLKVAREKGADILVIIDGDGQHDPAEIPQVLSPILKGKADLVIGSRFLGKKTNMPRYRKFGIAVITFLFNFGSKVKVSDAQSGFRAYSRRLLEAVFPTERGMSASVQVLLEARKKGFVIKEVPISCAYHPQSSHINPVVHGLAVALGVLKLRLRNVWRR